MQVGHPIDLAAFVARHPDASLDELSAALRFAIQRALSLEEKVVKGPALKRGKQLRQEILESQRMTEAIKALSAESGQSERSLTKEIDGYLKEMARRLLHQRGRDDVHGLGHRL